MALVQIQLLHFGVLTTLTAAQVDAALVVLHLLLRFKPLLAFGDRALKFILVLHRGIVRVKLLGRFEDRKADLARLYQPLYPTLVAEVRAAQFQTRLPLRGTPLGAWTLTVRICEANEKCRSGENARPLRINLWGATVISGNSLGKI